MREIRKSGSEGGARQTNVSFLPLSARRADACARDGKKSDRWRHSRDRYDTRKRTKKFLAKKFLSPIGCPIGVDKLSLEMIAKILFAIQAATRCFRPQNQFPSRFARQSEFLF